MNDENETHRSDSRCETDFTDVQGLGHLEIFLYEPGIDLKNSYYDCGAPITANEDYISGMPNWPGYDDDTPNIIESYDTEQQSINVSDNFADHYTTSNAEAESSRTISESEGFAGNHKDDHLIVRSTSPTSDTVIAAATTVEILSACRQTSIEQYDPCTSPPCIFRSEVDQGPSVLNANLKSTAVVLSQRKMSPGNREIKSPKQNVSEFRLYYDMLSALLTFRGASGRIAISSCLLLSRIVGRLLNHPCVLSVGGFASETMMFVADRTQCLSDHYLTSIIADDPEHLHIQRLLQAREALWGWVHQQSCFLSSLPWHQRQLLRETRDFDKHIEIATASLVNRSSGSAKADQINGEKHAFIKDEENVDIGDPTLLLRGGIAYVTHWLQGAAEDGDEEAQYALSRWFTRPAFEHSSQCYACSRQFNVTLFRHHCRCCGQSHCTQHSSQRRSLLRLGLGLISPVRVCDKCAAGVDQEVHIDNLTWRKMRVEAYLGNKSGVTLVKDINTPPPNSSPEEVGLIPYDNKSVDRNVDKIIRVADYSLKVIKSTVSLNYPTKLALHTVDILKRYGLSGLAGVLLRRDFMEAVETLKRISGIDRMFSLSLHELTACIYYKLAIDRGLRGCDPEGERVAHKVKPARESSADGAVCAGDIGDKKRSDGSTESHNSEEEDDEDPSACEELEEDELDDIIRFAPLALSAVYEESSADVQRLALAQGWATVFISSQSAPEQPAYALFASADERGERDGVRKEVVLAVRGTASVEDIVTDIRAAPQRFPPEDEDISKALFPTPSLFHYSRKTALSPDVNQGREDKAQRDNDGWLMISNDTDLDAEGEEKEESYACGGMARAALWLLGQVGPALLQLHAEGYEVIIVGHSMGGSVAALLCHLMRTHLSSAPNRTNPHRGQTREPPRPLGFRCITYGCPSSMCIRLARSMTPYVTSVVLHDDIVSRITPQSIRLLMRELLVFRQQVFRHLRQDWTDVIARARDLWSPKSRTRDCYTGFESQVALGAAADSSSGSGSGSGSGVSSSGTGAGCKSTGTPSSPSSAPAVSDSDDVPVVVEDQDRGEWIPSLWLPGRVLHLYSHAGRYKAVKVSRALPTLRRIEIQGNIFTDHASQTIFDALLEVRAVRSSDLSHRNTGNISINGSERAEIAQCRSRAPPTWTPYDASALCACCQCPFTWHSTFQGEAQEYRERYNCRHCGGLVCGPCSLMRRAIPRLGLIQPSRVCDKCFHKGDYAHI